MIARKPAGTLCAVALAAALLAPSAQAEATPSPAWRVESLALPTNFTPGDEAGRYIYEVRAVNLTAAPLDLGFVTLTDTLPAKLGVKNVVLEAALAATGAKIDAASTCETETVGEVATVTCQIPAKIGGKAISRDVVTLKIAVSTPAEAAGPLENTATVSGAGGGSATTTSKNEASLEPADSGLSYFHTEVTGPDGTTATQAASHPYLFTTSFAFNTESAPKAETSIPAHGDIRDINVALPPGLIGNPTATALCTQQEFAELTLSSTSPISPNNCPPGSVVGTLDALAEGSRFFVPIYNLVPPKGMPAQLGFHIASFPFFVDTALGAGPDFPILSTVRNSTEIERPVAARVTLWGTPNEANHDRQRGGTCLALSGASVGSCPAGEVPRPFLRLPTGCASPMTAQMLFNTWDDSSTFFEGASSMPAPEGCATLGFNPSFTAQPLNKAADSPSGLHVELHIPQVEEPELNGSADLRDVTVTLPEGLVVNPASAAGLEACTPAQIDLQGNKPANCPDASKVGTLESKSPLLDHPVKGSVYVASQEDNPFGSLIALYLAIDDPESGTVVKLAGEVKPDPVTGRITSTFKGLPQVPLEDSDFDFFEGPRAPLRTPGGCGTYATTASLRPWSAPGSGPDATSTDPFEVRSGPNGGPCPSGALQPKLSAGLSVPIAGSYSPFSLRLQRDDGTGELKALSSTVPPGLTAKLKGIPYCPEAGIAQAIARNKPGDGAAEKASPSCPAASWVGSVNAGAGAGTSPLYTPGSLYLAGPYKGASLSLVAIVPAVAGPFDLGVVVDRIALKVDPRTAQVSAIGDPFPTILSGIPLDVRDIQVSLDRPQFTLAPTNCEPGSIAATALGASGGSASLSERFQVGACAALGFAPRLFLKLKGGTKRGDHPALSGTYAPREGDANLQGLVLRLPHSAFLDQAHIKTICTRVQYAAGQGNGAGCPAASVYGQATAYTPLLDQPLSGPVYLRSSDHNLPDLVASLHGQVDVEAVARIDSKKGGIRASFEALPDAPLTKVVVQMQGQKKGLIVNSRDLCAGASKANARFSGQNGRRYEAGPVLQAQCAKGKRHPKQKRHKG